MTFEQYIEDHSSSQMRAYLTGYADAIHNNAYFFGGCPKRLQYRPYSEYMQHIDIYIAQKTADKSANKEIFLKKNIEPFLTEVILKYIDCNNPEAIQLEDEIKAVQLEVREVAKEIMLKTRKYQSIDEREMEFQYNQYLERLKNPTPKEKEATKLHGGKSSKKAVSKPIAEKLKEQAEAEHAKKQIVQEDEADNSGGGIFNSIKNKITDFLPGKKTEKEPEKVVKSAEKQVDKSVKPQDSAKKDEPAKPAGTSTPTVSAEKPITTKVDDSKKSNIDLSVPELQIIGSTPQGSKTSKPNGKQSGKKPNGKSAKEVTETVEELPVVSEENFKLDSMDINLDNLSNAKIPSM